VALQSESALQPLKVKWVEQVFSQMPAADHWH